jgi:hypothetical protein
MKQFKFLSKINPLTIPPENLGEEYTFIGVTPVMYEPISFDQIKFLLYRNVTTGAVVKGETISPQHELWNYHEEV